MSTPGEFNLPYEDVPDGPIEIDMNVVMVDQVVCKAAVADGGPLGPLPTLIFAFASSRSGPVPEIALVGSPETLLNLAEIITKAARATVREYHKRTR